MLFAYLGWNAPVYVASELRRPGRTLPLSLFFGGAERVHEVYRTPHRAIVVQGVVALALLGVLRTFPSILDYPKECAIGLGVALAGLPFYRLFAPRAGQPVAS